MANMAQGNATRSIRIDDETWELAKKRAEREGLTISRLLYLFTDGYARGLLDTPHVQVVYGDSKK